MNVSPSKENMLKKIRKALSHSTPLPFPQSEGNQPIFQPLTQDIAEQFSDRIIKTELSVCDVSITGCEYLVARTGSIVMSSAQASGRTTSVYAPIHICIAYTNQLVYDIKDALKAAKEKYGAHLPSMLTFATGPSRTADIEKALVVGVHGPKEVYLFLVEA